MRAAACYPNYLSLQLFRFFKNIFIKKDKIEESVKDFKQNNIVGAKNIFESNNNNNDDVDSEINFRKSFDSFYKSKSSYKSYLNKNQEKKFNKSSKALEKNRSSRKNLTKKGNANDSYFKSIFKNSDYAKEKNLFLSSDKER